MTAATTITSNTLYFRNQKQQLQPMAQGRETRQFFTNLTSGKINFTI